MGLLLELRKKLTDGTITDEEKATLQSLEADIKSENDEAEVAKEEEKAIDELSTKLADMVQSKLMSQIEKTEVTPKVEVTSESKFIVSPELGRKTVQELSDIKVEIPGRKSAGKQHTAVTQRTVEYIKALFEGDKQKLQVLVEGTGSRGGYLVPEDFVNIVVEDKRDMVVMRQLATILPVSTDTIHIPNLASRPQAFWRSEAAVKNTSTVDFGETVLTPYSLASIVTLSNELVADAALGGNIVTLVARYMTRALAEKEDRAFWTGSGSGEPTGIDNYSFTTVDGGITDSTRADAIISSIFKLNQMDRANAVFVANRNTWAKVATLKDNENNYLLSPLGSSASPTLRGLPTYEQNDIADGKMFVGDFSYYYIADRQGITVDTSTEATVASQSAFERNLTHVRVEERVDGELTLTHPIVEITSLGGA